ncbi:hypothetical protein ACLB2K_049708 [Fragaria x ananassa]
MRKDVKIYIAICDMCQRQNYEAINPPGLLQPLPILEEVFCDLSMDFVEGLPSSNGMNAILVVVDRLSKYGHFITIVHPYTASQIAAVFVKEVFQLHGMPRSIVSDRDPIFISHFWTSFFKLQGSTLCRSSACILNPMVRQKLLIELWSTTFDVLLRTSLHLGVN